MEIVADHDAGGAEFSDEELFHEVGRAGAGQRPVEAAQEHAVEPELFQDRELHRLRRQAEHRPVGREEGPRVRLEGKHHRRPAALPRHGFSFRDQRLVAAVNAIEISDRDDGAAEALGNGLAVAADRKAGLAPAALGRGRHSEEIACGPKGARPCRNSRRRLAGQMRAPARLRRRPGLTG